MIHDISNTHNELNVEMSPRQTFFSTSQLGVLVILRTTYLTIVNIAYWLIVTYKKTHMSKRLFKFKIIL